MKTGDPLLQSICTADRPALQCHYTDAFRDTHLSLITCNVSTFGDMKAPWSLSMICTGLLITDDHKHLWLSAAEILWFVEVHGPNQMHEWGLKVELKVEKKIANREVFLLQKRHAMKLHLYFWCGASVAGWMNPIYVQDWCHPTPANQDGWRPAPGKS